jgi:hypothetical protein
MSSVMDVLPGQRILLPLADTVAEFDGDGKMAWHVMTQGANSALRLPNGNTLVARGQGVSEFDRDGREVWSFQWPCNSVRIRRK